MSDIRIWVDGELVTEQTPAISAVDHGVTVGDGGFETAKIVHGVPFAVRRHLARMDRTLAGLGLPPADHDHIRRGIDAVLGHGDPIPFGRLRWTVTGGRGPLASDRHDLGLTTIVTAAPQDPPPAHGAVVISPWVRNERAATAGLKTTSYADNVVALAEAKARGGMEALMANSRGELCEGTGSNVFVVVDGRLSTPPLSSGCLAGVSRDLVLQWCADAGVAVHEETLALEVLGRADEAFLTSSIKDVFPISAIDQQALPHPGPVTSRVQQIFAERAAESCEP